MVEGYLRHDDYKFQKEIEDFPELSVDLLEAVKCTFGTLTIDYKSVTAEDPFSGRRIYFENRKK
jgi:hypothetical protein